MMTGKPAEVIGFITFHNYRAVGNPNAFPIEIHLTGRGVAGGFLRPGPGKERPVEHAEFRVPGWVRNSDGEEAGILVIHIVDLNAVIDTVGRKPQALPVEQVFRQGQGDAGSLDGKCRVSQDFHFDFPVASQYTPNRLRWDCFFILSIPGSSGSPPRGRPCLVRVRENQKLPHFHAISQTRLPSV